MDYRAAGMLSISMPSHNTTPKMWKKHILSSLKVWGVSHALLEHLVQKQTVPQECIHND